jgi:hypothetical protein
MRDMEKERELLAKAGLAAAASDSEALAATTDMLMPVADGRKRSTAAIENAGLAARLSEQRGPGHDRWGASAATEAEPTPSPAKGHTGPAGGALPLAATPVAEAPLKALARLRREAEERIEQLINLLDDIEGDPDLEDEPGRARLIHMRERLSARPQRRRS